MNELVTQAVSAINTIARDPSRPPFERAEALAQLRELTNLRICELADQLERANAQGEQA